MNFYSIANAFIGMLLDGDIKESGLTDIAKTIFGYIEYILIPVMIVVGAAGIIYSVYLGVNLAKADSADKRQEAKSRMVNAIIGFVCIFVLVLLMYLFVANVETIFGWMSTDSSGS